MENREKYELLKKIYEIPNLKYELNKAKDRAISKCFCEYMSGKEEHEYSNYYSCFYDTLKEEKQEDLIPYISTLIELKVYFDTNISNENHLHNFKVEKRFN